MKMLYKILLLAMCVSQCAASSLIRPTRARKPCSLEPLYAECTMQANPNIPSAINGTVNLWQEVTKRCRYGFLNIKVNIDNVPMNDNTKKHGFHVHQYGVMSGGCESMGPHYNPFGSKHGRRWNPKRKQPVALTEYRVKYWLKNLKKSMDSKRHVGDLGNVSQRGRDGKIYTRFIDYLAKLDGKYTIYGRGLVLHEKQDDLGMGNDPGSEKTGNAGRRLACCVIVQSPPNSYKKYKL